MVFDIYFTLIYCCYNSHFQMAENLIYENKKYKELLLNNLTNWSINNNIDIMWIELNNLDKNFDIIKNYTKNFKINFAFNSNDEILTKKNLAQISNLEAIDSDVDILSYNKLNNSINI